MQEKYGTMYLGIQYKTKMQSTSLKLIMNSYVFFYLKSHCDSSFMSSTDASLSKFLIVKQHI